MSYAEVRRKLDEQKPEDDGRLPCSFCSAPTLRETLSQYGARCLRCFEAWQVAPRTWPDIGDKANGPRDWAHALKRRHEAGEVLTKAQVDAYRAALSREGSHE